MKIRYIRIALLYMLI